MTTTGKALAQLNFAQEMQLVSLAVFHTYRDSNRFMHCIATKPICLLKPTIIAAARTADCTAFICITAQSFAVRLELQNSACALCYKLLGIAI